MKRILLAIDPGGHTGFARIDIDRERVLDYGEYRAGHADFANQIQLEMLDCLLLAVEGGQFVKDNAQSALAVSEAKGVIKGLWVIKADNLPGSIIEVHARTWQCRLGLRGNRKQVKRGAFMFAQREIIASRGDPKELTEHSADAICLGLFAVRQFKAGEILKEAQKSLIEGRIHVR